MKVGRIETRFVPVTRELRAIGDGEARGIEGYTAVYDSESVDMGFFEVIEPGAFGPALERSDPVALFNHDSNFVLGRASAGTLELEDRDAGLFFRVPDMPSSRADVLEAIERGDVFGNSFSFRVRSDRWETRDGREVRYIEEFEEIYDVGPVVFPAYPETTVSSRCAERIVGALNAGTAGVSLGDYTANTITVDGHTLSTSSTITFNPAENTIDADAERDRIAAIMAHRRRLLDLAEIE